MLSAGTRVRFRFDVGSERRWFAGVVKSYSKKRGYCIEYDNGELLTERLDTWSSSDFEVVAADCAEENVDGGCDGSPSPPHNASHETSIAGASDSGSSHASGAAATDESAIVRSAQRGAKDRGSQHWAQDSSGKWARVRVLREEDGQVLVRFLGWGEDFDEWIQVGAGRLLGSDRTRVGRQLSTVPKPNASGLDGEGCSKCRFTRCSKCHVTGSKRPRSSASEGKLPVGVAAVASGGARKRIRGERGIAADAPSAQSTDDSEVSAMARDMVTLRRVQAAIAKDGGVDFVGLRSRGLLLTGTQQPVRSLTTRGHPSIGTMALRRHDDRDVMALIAAWSPPEADGDGVAGGDDEDELLFLLIHADGNTEIVDDDEARAAKARLRFHRSRPPAEAVAAAAMAQEVATATGASGRPTALLPPPLPSPGPPPFSPPAEGTLEATLHSKFGHRAFRPGQRAVVDALLQGRDVLVVWPTDHGKSLTYQLPAIHTRKVVVVISPQISLMDDQANRMLLEHSSTVSPRCACACALSPPSPRRACAPLGQ